MLNPAHVPLVEGNTLVILPCKHMIEVSRHRGAHQSFSSSLLALPYPNERVRDAVVVRVSTLVISGSAPDSSLWFVPRLRMIGSVRTHGRCALSHARVLHCGIEVLSSTVVMSP